MVPGFGLELRRAVEELGTRDALVLSSRGLRPDDALGRPATLEQLGKVLGITRERVRQLEQRAWRRVLASVRRQLT